MKVIGLTGGIGSGKSTVSRLLAELGAVTIDADKVGHEAFQSGTALWREVVAAFGQQVLAPTGEIDRQALGKVVFDNPPELARLNGIMHPRMYDMVKEQIDGCRQRGVAVVVLEAALLIEAGWTSLVDEVWVVVASEDTVLQRIEASGKWSREQTRARIRAQLSSEERAKQADIVINNDGDLSALKAEVVSLWRRLQS